jgi:hypothetical protein
MKSRIIALGLGAFLMASGALVEAAPGRGPGPGHHGSSHQGRVLESRPIHKVVQVPVREKRCYDLPRSKHHGHGRPKQKCEMVTRHEKRKEVTGYKVKYEYRGRIYWTETRHEPGRFIDHRR